MSEMSLKVLNDETLEQLCIVIKACFKEENFEEGERMIERVMSQYPHSPIPHNLLGILLKKQGYHLLAMKHFRAAYDLDPTYLPARHNLDLYASFYPVGKAAFDEQDCMNLN